MSYQVSLVLHDIIEQSGYFHKNMKARRLLAFIFSHLNTNE